MKLWFVRCLMILALIGAGPAGAAQYHISPRGDDSNRGTAAKPWKTIAKVNAIALKPGDRVLFEAGHTYDGTIFLGSSDSGSPNAKVELTSYGEGRATINGGNASGLVSTGCSHLVITNLSFVGSGRKTGNTEPGVALFDGDGIEVAHLDISGFRGSGLLFGGVRDGRATHIYAHDNGADGIAVGPGRRPDERWSERLHIARCVAENNPGDPSNLDNHSGNGIVVGCVRDCLIEYCEAMNNGWDMPRQGNGPVGIWAWSADRVTIQFCVAHHNHSPGWDGGGFDFDGGVTNSVMQYNYSYENDGPGYFLCQYGGASVWRDNIIRYNISVNDGIKNNVGCGIEVISQDLNMSDAEVYNNTVYNARRGAVGFDGSPAPRLRFRNNIFVSVGDIIRGVPDAIAPARFEGNCYWSLDGAGFAPGHPTFDQWVAATGQEKVAEAIVGLHADPLFVLPGTVEPLKPDQLPNLSAYRLREGSPCFAAGLPIPDNAGRDFWGNNIPVDKKPTIGAYQHP